jgi:hypothetical protein
LWYVLDPLRGTQDRDPQLLSSYANSSDLIDWDWFIRYDPYQISDDYVESIEDSML